MACCCFCCCQEDEHGDVPAGGPSGKSKKPSQSPAVKQSMLRGDDGSDDDSDVKAVDTWRKRTVAETSTEQSGAIGGTDTSRPPPPQRMELSAEAFKVWKEKNEQNAKMATIDSIEVDELSAVHAEKAQGPVDLDDMVEDGDELVEDGDELDAMVLALNEKDKSSEDDDVDIPVGTDKNKRRKSPTASPKSLRISPSGRDSPTRRRSPSVSHDSGDSQPSPGQSSRKVPAQISHDSLSDVPSNIDAETKARYLMACRLLKSALIQKETALMPTEKSFLKGLIDESGNAPSEAQVSAIETASHTLLSDPLFQFASSASDARLSSVDSVKAAWSLKREKERANNVQMNRPETVTPVIQSEPPGRKMASTADRETNMSPERQPPSRNESDYPFLILGIQDVRPGVLTPPLMEALRGFFPYGIAEENFWLKFSLERDGASLPSLLSKVRTSVHTILSVETKDGHVFGAFCSSPWRVKPGWYGSGESFLWRLKNSRITSGTNVRNYDHDNEMEVYPFTGNNEMVQYCTKKTIAVGGGDWGDDLVSPYPNEPTGTGFMIDGDLMGGETNSCSTFANPRLCGRSSKKNEFDIINLEVWTVTPCISEPDAELLEMRRLFVEENIRKS